MRTKDQALANKFKNKPKPEPVKDGMMRQQKAPPSSGGRL